MFLFCLVSVPRLWRRGPFPRHFGTRVECRFAESIPPPTERDKQKAERECLIESHGRIQRANDRMVLRNRDGTQSVIKDNRSACAKTDPRECKVVTIDSFDPARGFVISRIARYESETYYFHDTFRNTETEILARPEFSPDGETFVAVDADQSNDRDADFAVYEIGSSGLLRKLKYVATDFDPKRYENWGFGFWKDGSRLVLFVSPSDYSAAGPKNLPVSLERETDRRWVVRDWPRVSP